MVYSLGDIKDKIICGDVVEELKKFPDESIDCVITSPPYWGVRDYGVEGQIGLEVDVDEYIGKMLEVFSQIKRVLKKAGSVWVNIGDSYNSVPCGNKKVSKANEGYDGVYVRVMRRNLSFVDATCSAGLYTKPGSLTARKRVNKKGTKSMLLLPERLVIRLMDEQGWTIRQKVIWCLEENTELFVLIDGKYYLKPIKEIFELSKFKQIKIPAWSKEGIKWVRIKSVFDTGVKEVFEIQLTNGKKVFATSEHKFPVIVSPKPNFRRKKDFIVLNFKKVKELKPYKDKLYVLTKIDRENEKVGKKEDYIKGLLVGWYLAEGSGVWTKSPTKLTVNKKDLQKLQPVIKWGKIKRIRKMSTCNAYEVFLTSGSKGTKRKPLVDLIRKFIKGKNCKEKIFTDEIWNTSKEFLKGVLDGFLEGDGSWDSNNKRWRIRISYNPDLVKQLETICLLLNKQIRIENNNNARGFGKIYKILSFSIQDWDKRIVHKNCSYQAIRSIKNIGLRKTYDLEIEPIYTSYCGKGTTDKPTIEKRKAKWNNLYFLGNGILTHNSKQILLNKERKTIGTVLPTSVKDRFNTSWEYLYHLVKNKKYYFDLEAVKLPVKEDTIRRIERYIKNNEASRLNNAELHKRGPLVGDRVMLGMQYLKKYKTGYEGARKLRKCPDEGWWEGGLKQKEAKQQGMHTFYTHNRRMYYSLTKNIPTVWQINPEPHNFRKELGVETDHFAVFPCELVKIPILSSCPADGIVLDPFCGSGTTLVVAKQLGRHYVGIDINEKYCQIAQKRIEKEVSGLI